METSGKMNHMLVISPYWDDDSGTWVFDEANFGLIKEPFVLGIPHMIDNLVKDIDNSRSGFRLVFSSKQFPEYDNVLTRLFEDMDGWWYQDRQLNKGWLCPAMFYFFDKAPERIYVKAEAVA